MMTRKNNVKLTPLVPLVPLLAWIACGQVLAASFDCKKAQSKVEHLICDNPGISKLDDELAASYKSALRNQVQAKAVSLSQHKWLKERNECSDADCMEMAYRVRIDELKPVQNQGRFIAVLSKDKPLCDAYKRYILWEINETQNGDRPQYRRTTSLGNFGSLTWYDNPPQCKRPFGENFSDFSPVKWREIKPEDYPELSGQAERYLSYWPWGRPKVAHALTDAGFKEDAKEMISQHSNNWVRMWLGEADIGNNGHVETLLKIDDKRCGFDPYSIGVLRPAQWSVPVIVVDASGKKIDTLKSEWILGVSVLPKALKPTYGDIHSLMLESFDVFSSSGKTYYDRWEDEWVYNSRGEFSEESHTQNYAALTVYTVSQERTVAVCRFKINKQAY